MVICDTLEIYYQGKSEQVMATLGNDTSTFDTSTKKYLE